MINITDTALSLAATGLPVFPCNSEKKPLVTGWQHKASTDQNSIRTMFSVSSAAMIGVPTGEASGFFAVDLDFRHGAGEWHEAKRGELPATRIHRTMNGGLHYLFKTGARGIRNSTGKLAQGVDVRGDGGYVIFPPSAGYSIDNQAEIADAPEWLVEAALAANSKTAPAPAQPVQATPPRVSGARPWHSMSGLAKATQLRAQPPSNEGTPYGRAALESACQEIRAAIDGGKHEVINRAAYSIGGLVSAGEILERDAFADLSAALGEILHRCKDRKAAQNTLRRAFDEGRGKARSVPEMPLAPPIEVHPAAAFLEKFARIALLEQREAARRNAAIPEGVYAVDGLLKAMMDDCLSRAYRPQPFLALAAAISAMAAAAGRRYMTSTGLRPNMYLLSVAPSGAGKDQPLDYVRQVLCEAGLQAYVGGEEPASGAAILTALSACPVQIFCLDEIGLMLQSMTGKKAAPHKAEIIAIMMKLFSRAQSVFYGKQYADAKERPRQDIHNPHLAVFGATTPGTLWGALEGGAMIDGSVARMMVFASDRPTVPRNNAQFRGNFPQAILEGLSAAAQGAEGHDYGDIGNNMIATAKMAAYPVPYAPGAAEAMEVHYCRQDEWQARVNDPEKGGKPGEGEVVARIGEHAAKLAMIAAISDNPAAPVIEARHVEWAWLLTNHCAQSLLRQAGQYVADSDFEKKLQKALQIIEKHGPVSERDLIRRGLKYTERERQEIIRTLLASEAVEEIRSAPGVEGGRPALKYALRLTAE